MVRAGDDVDEGGYMAWALASTVGGAAVLVLVLVVVACCWRVLPGDPICAQALRYSSRALRASSASSSVA